MHHAVSCIRRMAFVLGLTAIAACGSTEPSANITGDYALTTVNGRALPTTAVLGGFTFTLDHGTLSVGPISYTLTIALARSTSASGCGTSCDTEQTSGSWTRESDGSLQFVDDGDSQAWPATFTNGKLTVTYDAMTLGFAKQ